MNEQFNTNVNQVGLINIEVLLNELREDLPKNPNLPNNLEKIVKNQEGSQKIFNIVLQYWQETYSQKKVLEALSTIIANKKESAEFLQAMRLLKTIRKSGNILLSTFLMLDKNHFAPEKHWKVVMNMGKVRDYAGTIQIEKYANRLSEAINDYSLKDMINNFQPDSQAGFEQFISNTLDNMQNIVLTAQPDNVRALHVLRKNGTRLLMNLFQISCLINPQSDHYQMFAYLKMLDEELGNAHDVAEVKRIQQAGSYDGVEMVISEKLKSQILDTINFLAKKWQLDFDKSTEIKTDLSSEDNNEYLS
jgi:hypothetical protein